MKVNFYHENRRLESMLKDLARANNIEFFYLFTYIPMEARKEIRNDLPGRKTELDAISLNKDTFSVKRGVDEVVSLSSKVKLESGKIVHLRQLDIDVRDKDVEESLKYSREIFKEIYSNKRNYGGFLVSSGKGFHYYGEGILSERGFERWMNSAKQSEKVDKDWCDEQLKRGYSILRVGKSVLKPNKPRLLYEVKIC